MAILKVANVHHDASGFTRTQISTANTYSVYTSNAERLTVDPAGNMTVTGFAVASSMNLVPTIQSAFGQANTGRDHANNSYSQANTARLHANNAHLTANAAFDQANTARTHANTAHLTANAAFDQANTARTHANTAHLTANAGFTQANTARTHANTAHLTANAAFDQANTARNHANSAFTAANNASAVGKQTIFVPATAMTSQITNGAAYGQLEMNTNKNMISYLAFDSTTSEGAQFGIQMPKSWNEGNVIAQMVWTHPIGTSAANAVVWSIRSVARSNNDTLDVAFGPFANVTANGGTANSLYISPETGNVTVSTTAVAEEFVIFRVERQPAATADTMGVDAYLLGVKVHYTVDTAKDD